MKMSTWTRVLRGLLVLIVHLFSFFIADAQSDQDALTIRSIHDFVLTKGQCYRWLDTLTQIAPGRLAGSRQISTAEDYMVSILDRLGVDTVWKQPCMAPRWERGEQEQVRIKQSDGSFAALHTLALGNSIGTDGEWISGEVVEVFGLDEVDSLGEELAGKIVFFNRPMDPTKIRTFEAYGGAVDQRVFGASRAAVYGAQAVLVRSMTTLIDTVPHTGTLKYLEDVDSIPALAISTYDSEYLSNLLDESTKVEVQLVSYAKNLGEEVDHNVIGEIRGSTYPEEIILVGGHLDAWDVGGGAHDDGAGCVHALEVFHTLLSLGIVPKRTWRCVLFANEENGLAGGKEYARLSTLNNERHLLALESDAGGFNPTDLSFEGNSKVLKPYYSSVSKWTALFEPYGIQFNVGGSGADISALKDQPVLLSGLRVSSQRYFDFHHTSRDRIEHVNERELKLGSAVMSSLVYLVDRYGLE